MQQQLKQPFISLLVFSIHEKTKTYLVGYLLLSGSKAIKLFF